MSRKLHTISLTFSVYDDDMPSERRALYRTAAITAMANYQQAISEAISELGDDNVDTDAMLNYVLIDKMLEDRNR